MLEDLNSNALKSFLNDLFTEKYLFKVVVVVCDGIEQNMDVSQTIHFA